MGFFSSIKRLWSSNKTAETPGNATGPGGGSTGRAASGNGRRRISRRIFRFRRATISCGGLWKNCRKRQPQSSNRPIWKWISSLPDNLLNRTGKLPHLRLPPNLPPQPDAPKEPSGWRDTLLLTLREAEPRLSVWLSIALEDLGPDARTGDELWERVRFLLTALGAPENEADAFVADFAAWAARMEYEEVADFRSELQYRLALALDLEDEEDERNRIFLKLHQGAGTDP